MKLYIVVNMETAEYRDFRNKETLNTYLANNSQYYYNQEPFILEIDTDPVISIGRPSIESRTIYNVI